MYYERSGQNNDVIIEFDILIVFVCIVCLFVLFVFVFTLVVEQFLVGLDRVFKVWRLDDRIDRTCFLAEAAEDALRKKKRTKFSMKSKEKRKRRFLPRFPLQLLVVLLSFSSSQSCSPLSSGFFSSASFSCSYHLCVVYFSSILLRFSSSFAPFWFSSLSFSASLLTLVRSIS